MTRRPRVLAAFLVAAAIGAAVVVPARPAQAGGRPDLPPSSRDALARIFDPALEQYGLRTTRALLQNADSYERDANGRHLAIYVEPVAEITDAEYVANITTVARVFLPRVFKRWSALESMDVCQEPAPTLDDGEAPPPVTQLAVTRAASKRFPWKRATLSDVIAAALIAERTTPEGARQDFYLYVTPRVAATPDYLQALAAVEQQPGTG